MKDNNLKDISRNEDIMNIYTRFNSDEFKEKQKTKNINFEYTNRNENIINIYIRFNSDEFKEKQREDIIKFNKLLERKEKHNFSRHKYYLKYGK